MVLQEHAFYPRLPKDSCENQRLVMGPQPLDQGHELAIEGQPTRIDKDPAALVYFSFITLSTVGYGDITPLSPPARSFAFMEAIIGQIYLAVLVARLVGLHIVYSTAGAP